MFASMFDPKSFAAATVLLLPALLLPGCVARTVANVATAPVKVASKTVDLATTSQSEADEKRGRELRKREERLGKLEREYAQHSRECERDDSDACDKAREDYAEIQELLPTVPAEPR
jgi:hypothetical protein